MHANNTKKPKIASGFSPAILLAPSLVIGTAAAVGAIKMYPLENKELDAAVNKFAQSCPTLGAETSASIDADDYIIAVEGMKTTFVIHKHMLLKPYNGRAVQEAITVTDAQEITTRFELSMHALPAKSPLGSLAQAINPWPKSSYIGSSAPRIYKTVNGCNNMGPS